MGVNDVVEDGSLVNRDDLTIGELKQHFGEEVVRRGIQYMNSLKEADENFRDSADPEDMQEGYKKFSDRSELGDEAKEGSDKWARAMEEGGLGLDDE